MPSNPFFEAMFSDLMDPQELAQVDLFNDPQSDAIMAPSRAVLETGRDKPDNAVYGKTDRPLPKGDVFPESPKPTFADGGLMAPDQTYLAPQADGDMEEVPPGATPNGVKDDIDIKISEGEIVVPEDVARWHGLKWFMEAREEAKQGLASMAAEGLIKKPQGVVEANPMPTTGSGLMAPEMDEPMEFAEGGTADDGKDGSVDGGSKNDTSSSEGMSSVDNAGFGYDTSAVDGAKDGFMGDPTKDEEQSLAPAATVGMGFNPGRNPEMGGSRGRSSQSAAIDNVANLSSSALGQMGSRFGGSFNVAQNRDSGLFGTEATMNPGTAIGAAASMMSGVPGLGSLGGYAANAMGLGQQSLGIDMTNNGMQGMQDSNVAGFGVPGVGVSNIDGGDDGLTAMEALMRRPY